MSKSHEPFNAPEGAVSERARVAVEPQEYVSILLPRPLFEYEGQPLELEITVGGDGRVTIECRKALPDDAENMLSWELWAGTPTTETWPPASGPPRHLGPGAGATP